MFPWESEPQDHYLFGTLVVRVVDSGTGEPLGGVHLGISDDFQAACRKG